IVQTIRIATNNADFESLRAALGDEEIRISLGSLSLEQVQNLLNRYHESHNVNFNIELADTEVTPEHVDVLVEIIRNNPTNTFNFTYLFNGVPTPYFPSAMYQENGFAIGLQPTDLAENCDSLDGWFKIMKETWE